MNTPIRHEKTLLIRSEFLNHYGTLFGGYMMHWADDMAYNAASLAYPGASFVTKLSSSEFSVGLFIGERGRG